MPFDSNFHIRAFDGEGWGHIAINDPQQLLPMSFQPLSTNLEEQLSVPKSGIEGHSRGVLLFDRNPYFPEGRKPYYVVVPFGPKEYLKHQKARLADPDFRNLVEIFNSVAEHFGATMRYMHIPFIGGDHVTFLPAQRKSVVAATTRAEKLGIRAVNGDAVSPPKSSVSIISIQPAVKVKTAEDPKLSGAASKGIDEVLMEKGLVNPGDLEHYSNRFAYI